MQSVQTYVHSNDPISRAGVISQLRPRPEVRLITDDEIIDSAVAVIIADQLDENTVEVLHRFRRRGCRLVLVARTVDETGLAAAVEAGIGGLVRRDEATDDALVHIIQRVSSGDGAIPPDLLGRFLEHVGRLQRQVLSPRGIPFTGLTHRERDVLKLVAEGCETSEIAASLCYSERTIKNVLHDLTTRLQLRNRSHAVAYAVREGLI